MAESRIKTFLKNNMIIIVAFAIPVLVLSGIFIFSEVYPFGEEMYLRSDCYHQYAPFMRALQRALQENRSLSYIWEIGLGSNFSSTYAYYLASPLNWLVALFPADQVTTLMDVFIVLKSGLMSATFTYYLMKHFKGRSWLMPAFGIFYGLSSYVVAFSWNLMWLDCLVLLPLIMLGLERLVKERKVILYTVTLGLCVLSNYYIGIMVCMFVVIYFIYLIICDGRQVYVSSKKNKRNRAESDYNIKNARYTTEGRNMPDAHYKNGVQDMQIARSAQYTQYGSCMQNEQTAQTPQSEDGKGNMQSAQYVAGMQNAQNARYVQYGSCMGNVQAVQYENDMQGIEFVQYGNDAQGTADAMQETDTQNMQPAQYGAGMENAQNVQYGACVQNAQTAQYEAGMENARTAYRNAGNIQAGTGFAYNNGSHQRVYTDRSRTAGQILGTIVRFGWYSILAGLMAMIIVLPAIFALSGTASSNSVFPTAFNVYNNFLQVLSKGTILTECAVFSGYYPNMFCTCAAFILVPLFWINRRISLKRKIGLTLIMAFFIVSFNTNVLTYIWHVFHYPNSLPCRQAFLFIAVVLVIMYEALSRIRDYTKLQLIIVGAVGIAANAVFYLMFKDSGFTVWSGIATAGFVAAYTVVLCLFRYRKVKYKLIVIMLLFLCVGECVLNSALTGYTTAGRTYYLEDNDAITKLLDSIDDDGFYRVEKVNRKTKNDGTWSDYRSASIFSSAANDGVTKFYAKMGMQSSMNAFSYYGHTPFILTILGIKYELSRSNTVEDSMKVFLGQEEFGNNNYMYLYENKYVLGLGYAVNDGSEDDMNLISGQPFESQNSFCEAICGVTGLFSIQKSVTGQKASDTFINPGRGCIYIKEDIDKAHVTITRNGETILDKEFSDFENPHILDVGDVQAGDIVTAECTDNEHSGTSLTLTVASMSEKKLEEAYNILKENQLEISEFDEGYVKGTIHLDEGKELFTTIPADDGWTVIIDGQKSDWYKYQGAFLAVKMAPGDHEIEFVFETPGQSYGIIMFVAGLVLFVLSAIILSKKRKKWKVI